MRTMSDSSGCLIDSNILIYLHDSAELVRQAHAIVLLDYLVDADRAVVSVQCLTEFFNGVTKRIPTPFPPVVATDLVRRFVEICSVLELTPVAVLEGCRAASEYQMSLWDALIWAVAKVNRIPVILTEDMQHRLEIDGVRYINPFASDFDVNQL
jgi:predicted nucleic acid-binding protein